MIGSFVMALRGLIAYRGRSFLAVLGIAIAAFLMITVLSLLFNFKNGLLNQFNGVGARQITVMPGKLLNKHAMSMGVSDLSVFSPSTSTLTYKDAMDVKAKVKQLTGAAPQNEVGTSIFYGKQSSDILFTGTTPDLAGILGFKPSAGRFISRGDISRQSRTVVLGANVAKTLFGEKGKPVGKEVSIKGAHYRVIGVLQAKDMFGFNINDRVYAAYPVVEKAGNIKNASLLFFQAQSTAVVPTVEGQIDSVIMANHQTKDYGVVKSTEAIRLVNMVMSLVTAITVGITGVSFIVGGIGIMNVMLLTVKERTREIGIRKAVGARSWRIVCQFLFEAILLSIVGVGFGLAVSYLALREVHTRFPVLSGTIPVSLMQNTLVFALLAGLLFGILPALNALRVQPIEALRYE